MQTLVVIGTSENVEAEFGSAADDAAFTLMIIEGGEVLAVEGYSTKDAALLAKADCHECAFEYLF